MFTIRILFTSQQVLGSLRMLKTHCACHAMTKNKIKLGAPSEPLALTHRNRKVPVLEEIKFEVSDHGIFIKTHLKKSVMAHVKFPANKIIALSNYHESETMWILKETTLYPSLACQHAEELIKEFRGMPNPACYFKAMD